MPTIVFLSDFTATFPSVQAAADAAHLLAVSTGQLVKLHVGGGVYAEFFGHGSRYESNAYQPYVSGDCV